MFGFNYQDMPTHKTSNGFSFILLLPRCMLVFYTLYVSHACGEHTRIHIVTCPCEHARIAIQYSFITLNAVVFSKLYSMAMKVSYSAKASIGAIYVFKRTRNPFSQDISLRIYRPFHHSLWCLCVSERISPRRTIEHDSS